MQMECYCKQKCLSRSALSKSNPNFRDIPRNVEENEMLLEIFRVVHTYVGISFSLLHFELYLGKSIAFGTVCGGSGTF